MNKKLVDAIGEQMRRQLAQTSSNAPTARYYYGIWIGAESSDANLSIVQLSTGTRARFVPKLAHVTGLSAGAQVVLIQPSGMPMHIVGVLTGNTYSASVPFGDTTAPTAPGTPTVSSHTSSSLTVAWTAATDAAGIAGYDVYVNGGYNQSVLSNTATVSGLKAGTTYSITVQAHDTFGNIGPVSGALVATTDGAAAGTPGTTYTKQYAATWSRTFNYNSNNEYDSWYGSTAYQGTYQSGNRKSMIGFNWSQIQADLSGSSSVSASIRLTYAHWYYNNGGTAIIGTHNDASGGPATFSGTTGRWQSANWAVGETRAVNLGANVCDEFRNGTTKGIVLGPGPSTSVLYYGYAYGAGSSGVYVPLLTLSYVK